MYIIYIIFECDIFIGVMFKCMVKMIGTYFSLLSLNIHGVAKS